MSASNIKDMRKQLRNVVQEAMPGVLSQELYTNLLKHLNERMDVIEKNVMAKMEEINNRSKDVQSYVLRSNIK